MERDLIRKYFLEANPREDRRYCPDEATLQAIAQNRFPLNHPARLHLASCSPCFAEFRGFKIDGEDRRRRRRAIRVVVGMAASLLVGVVLEMVPFQRRAEVTRTIDLFSDVTRGLGDDVEQLDRVSLPTTIVHLKIVLPPLSPAGHYKVAVSSDRTGDNTVARGYGIATGSDRSTTLNVTLDLRKAPRGSYFLLTEREQDEGAYGYPLKLQLQ